MTSTTAPSTASPTTEPLSAARQALAEGRIDGALLALTGLRHLNAHEVSDRHCLCARCITTTGCRSEHQGVEFVLDVASADGRALFYWVPTNLLADRARIAARVTRRLGRHLKQPRQNPARELAFTRHRIEQRR